MEKSINTLVEDMYDLFSGVVPAEGVDVDSVIQAFGEDVKASLKRAITKPATKERKVPDVRMSRIGRPDRQLWYEHNCLNMTFNGVSAVAKETALSYYDGFDPKMELKMLYGHLVEALVLTLAKLSGHQVESEQMDVSLAGVPGHIDAVIDGVVVDVKSASNYSFKKFANGTLWDNDPFGYRAQISGYSQALKKPAAFLAFNKETADMALLEAPRKVQIDVEKRVKHLDVMLNLPSPPAEKCYPDEEYGKAGNRVLAKGCSWCAFKHLCWGDANNGQGLRAFDYSTGPVYFTKVVSTPSVKEIDLTDVGVVSGSEED